MYASFFVSCFPLWICISWYIGVDVGDGVFDETAVIAMRSKVAFEWRLQRTDGAFRIHIVTPMVKHVIANGVPAPVCNMYSQFNMEKIAHDAPGRVVGRLRQQFGSSDLSVTCKYMGVIRANGIVVEDDPLNIDTVAFEWTMCCGDCEWKQDVQIRARDLCTRSLPLPSCCITHARLHKCAEAASQAACAKYGVQIRCLYPAIMCEYVCHSF